VDDYSILERYKDEFKGIRIEIKDYWSKPFEEGFSTPYFNENNEIERIVIKVEERMKGISRMYTILHEILHALDYVKNGYKDEFSLIEEMKITLLTYKELILILFDLAFKKLKSKIISSF